MLSKKINITINLTLLVLTTISCAVVAEFVSRKIIPSQRFFNIQSAIPEYEKSGQSFKYKPYCKRFIKTEEYSVWHKTNSLGMRQDTDPFIEKDNKKIRVAFLGDSFTYGVGVESNETFAKLLESSFVETLNFGVIGHGPLEEKEFFEKMVVNFSPDVTIICFFTGNDLDNAQNGLKRFDVDKGFLIHPSKMRFSFLQNVPLYKTIRHFFIKHSNLYICTADLVDCIWPPPNNPVNFYKAFAETTKAFKKIKRITDACNSKLVIVVIPDSTEVFGSTSKQAKFLNNFPVHKKLKEFAKDNEIAFYDLLEDFRNHPDPKKLYYTIDCHFNREGHLFVAKKISNFLDKYLDK